jgi:putative lipoic acid-binding regulatory protein
MKMPVKTILPKAAEEVQDAPKIEFPCANYPIKVVGQCIAGYDTIIIEVLRRYDPALDVSKVHGKDSAKGTFRSTTLYITATGHDQLKQLHVELSSLECVKMVM